MNKLNLVIPAIFVSLLSFVSADTRSYGCGMFGFSGMMGGYGTGWMFFGWIFWILILVALVLLIAWLIKQIQKPNKRR